MICSECPYNNNSTQQEQNIIRHPQGNVLELTIPLTKITARTVNGVTTTRENEFPFYDVVVSFIRGNKTYDYKPKMSVNIATITDYGTLPLGTYSIEIRGRGIDGIVTRYKQNTVLVIVDATKDGCVYNTDEFDVKAHYTMVKGRTSAILVGDTNVDISEGGTYQGDANPNDGYADMTAAYGNCSMRVTETEVQLTI